MFVQRYCTTSYLCLALLLTLFSDESVDESGSDSVCLRGGDDFGSLPLEDDGFLTGVLDFGECEDL